MNEDKNGISVSASQRLEAWMQEITSVLCYQPDIPVDHKTVIADAMHEFSEELKHMHMKRIKASKAELKETI